jgi:hypothetical protein
MREISTYFTSFQLWPFLYDLQRGDDLCGGVGGGIEVGPMGF